MCVIRPKRQKEANCPTRANTFLNKGILHVLHNNFLVKIVMIINMTTVSIMPTVYIGACQVR